MKAPFLFFCGWLVASFFTVLEVDCTSPPWATWIAGFIGFVIYGAALSGEVHENGWRRKP